MSAVIETLPDTEAASNEVAQFVAEHWDPEISVAEWWERLAGAGLTSPMLPVEHGGRGYPRDLAAAVGAALSRSGVLGPPTGIGQLLAAPTIVTHGDPEQIRRFVPRILDGRDGWCQLFSEPGAGSDLAGLQTRAERDGDQWVINGQKVWTSTGQHADWGMLLARTDPDAPKHRGITWFAFPMHQAGVDVRPLREMTGRAIFNEVFLDDARVSDDCIIGDLHDGWRVANTTLAFERAGIGGGGDTFAAAIPGSIAGHLQRRAGEFLGEQPGGSGVGRIGPGMVRRLARLAADSGRHHEPVLRQELARLWCEVELTRLLVMRARHDRTVAAAVPNIAKLRMSHTTRLARDLGARVLGPGAALWGEGAPSNGTIQELIVFSPAPSIYGGSDEIQRNILGERILGLPKEPGPPTNTPFRDLPQGVVSISTRADNGGI